MNNIGDFLKNERDKRGLSLREFALLLGTSPGYLSKLENGKDPRSGKMFRPTLDTLVHMAKGLKMSLDDMLFQIGYLDNNVYNEEFLQGVEEEYQELVSNLGVREIQALKKIKEEGYTLQQLAEVLDTLRNLLPKK
jgi:transcriptional regulator with XRE-family HTH domain